MLFRSVFDGWRTIQYSDSFETSWALCGGQIIDLYQTAGDLVRGMVLGRSAMCFKTDGVVKLQWVAGAVRFTQELLAIAGGQGTIGTNSPLSISPAGEGGLAMLGTNGIIYVVTQNAINAVSPEALVLTLPVAQSLLKFKYARAITVPSQDLYVLFYDGTGLAGQFLDSFVTWNYRTGEFSKGKLGIPIIGAAVFKQTNDGPETIVLSTNTLVESFDTQSNPSASDDGVLVNRYWTTGWQQPAGEEGWFYGVRVVMRKSANARIKVSVARNLHESFDREQTFSLRGVIPTDKFVECNYWFPTPVWGRWFNVKVRMFHDLDGAITELPRIGFIAQPKKQVAESSQQIGQARESAG